MHGITSPVPFLTSLDSYDQGTEFLRQDGHSITPYHTVKWGVGVGGGVPDAQLISAEKHTNLYLRRVRAGVSRYSANCFLQATV